jgi:putative peptide zinc metalloprotease protein
VLANEKEKVLPNIREDLKLLEASPCEDGTKQWNLFDPIQNKYFTIGIDTFELIKYWQAGISTKDFIERLQKKDYEIDEESLLTFIGFLSNSGLTKCLNKEDNKRIIEQKKKSKQTLFKWLMHNYLFIKVPVFKPDKWLSKNYHRIDFLYSSLWSNFVFVIGLIGILLVIRDWDNFSSTFMYLFSKEGIIYYGLSLVFVKSLHELGHAFTAKRYGCKIPSVGVAFLVMFPVLYTDTTNAYAIKSKYKRLRIVLAGMKVEIYLALIATFLWSFLPDGPLKSIAFILATTSWITSLLVNISPFLRFDGYYALSDWTDNANLQPRSFAMAKWFIRFYILGLDEKEPENLPKKKKTFFIAYAISTWIYRLFLFLGIAFLVYYFAFKVLGIILFLVEIIWFIILPVFNELKVWYEKKQSVKFNKRNKISLLVFSIVFILLFIPWNSKIYLPAVLEAKNFSEIYSLKNGYISEIYVKNGDKVQKDQILMKIKSDELEYNIEKVQMELNLLLEDLKRQAANRDILDNKLVLQENIYKKEKELKGFLELENSLNIKAPFSGIIYFNDIYKSKQYVNIKEPILTIYDINTSRLIGYCEDVDYKYLKENAKGKFVSNIPKLKTLDLTLKNISLISLSALDYEELSSVYGGEIATRETKEQNQKNLISEKAYFKVEAKIENFNLNLKTRINGIIIIESDSSSFVNNIFRNIYNVLIKETGF